MWQVWAQTVVGYLPSAFGRDKNGAMKRVGMLSGLMLGLILSCGGARGGVVDAPVGDTHATAGTDDLDVVPAGASAEAGMGEDTTVNSTTGDGAEPGDPDATAGDAAAESPAAAVTFRLQNQADEDLVFNIDKGWQAVIIAYSGQPPNAVPIVMFPKFCTASCDLDTAERCPYCPEPENVREVKAAEKHQVVPSQESFALPWDGQVLLYEDTSGSRDGRNLTCECHRKQPVPAETYTVRACGLRLTKSAKKSSKMQCATGTMAFPAEGPQVVDLVFAAP